MIGRASRLGLSVPLFVLNGAVVDPVLNYDHRRLFQRHDHIRAIVLGCVLDPC